MKKIDIPEIFPENIIGLSIKDSSASFRYSDESDNIIQLFFGIVYEFDYTEEDYIYSYNEAPGFGLYEVYDSEIIKTLIEKGMYKDNLDLAFGGEYNKLKHYTLRINEEGVYNFVCKEFEISETKPV